MLKNNLDKEFDYTTIKATVVKSLGKIVKQEVLKNIANSITNDIVSDREGNFNSLLSPPTPSLLKLKIRNTTQYLNWRLSILKRDNFTLRYVMLVLRRTKAYD
jgi:hypothetical protein